MGSSTTTRNFGMRRFTNLVREGRFRAPAAADLRLGTFVEIDPAAPDRVRQATATAIGAGGNVRVDLCGILWYEHDSQTYNHPEWGGAAGQLMQDLDTAPRQRMIQILHGPGVKVWFRNTALNTTEPGLNFPSDRAAVTMVSGLGGATPTVEVGELLGWNNSSKWYEVTTDLDHAFMRVTSVDNDFARCDAELLY